MSSGVSAPNHAVENVLRSIDMYLWTCSLIHCAYFSHHWKLSSRNLFLKQH